MKKTFILSALLLFVLSATAQDIINHSFELWNPYSGNTSVGFPFSGQNPSGWTTSDSLSQTYLGGASVFPGTDPQDGNKSIHLKSTQITVVVSGLPFQITVPGIATNGTLTGDFTTLATAVLKFIGGSPDTSRSSKLIGYFKYVPQAAIDQAYISVYKLKYNSQTGQRDTIAKGELVIGDTVAAYQPFEVILNYRDFINQPDTSLIILKSGYLPETVVFSNPDVTVGSELTVDQLSFTGFVGIDDINPVKDFTLFPSPASSTVQVAADINGRSGWGLQVLDISGKQMTSGVFTPSGSTVDVSGFANGNYLFQLIDEQGAIVLSRQFTVAR